MMESKLLESRGYRWPNIGDANGGAADGHELVDHGRLKVAKRDQLLEVVQACRDLLKGLLAPPSTCQLIKRLFNKP